MAGIVIVFDGQYRWGADRAELEAALRRLGWRRKPGRWIEPDMGEDADPMAAYARLCAWVQPLDGYAVGEEGVWEGLPVLSLREDLAGRVWTYGTVASG